MTMDHFDLLCRLVRERSGLVLTRDKGYLVESRLMPVARRFGVKGLPELAAAVERRSDPTIARAIVEAMTTNETQFFRDGKPFEQFRKLVLPGLVARRAARKTIRIWCAASSSGQEPYSIAMLCREEPRLAGWKIEIVATDISMEMIERAKLGIYGQFEVQRGLPIQMLVKYFKQIDGGWQLNPEIRAAVQYRQFNLLDDSRGLGSFDVVFCRNVLIYFDKPTKSGVLERIAQRLPDDGVLFLGGSETVLGITDRFEQVPHENALYRPVARAAAQLAVA